MTTRQIINCENGNNSQIILHTEGMFCVAYEASALLLVKSGVKLVPSKKYVKKEDCEIVSVGFPAKQMEQRTSHLKRLSEEGVSPLVFDSGTSLLQGELENFKKTIVIKAKPPKKVILKDSLSPAESDVLRLLKDFNIASATPIEAMSFLNLLKCKLDKASTTRQLPIRGLEVKN